MQSAPHGRQLAPGSPRADVILHVLLAALSEEPKPDYERNSHASVRTQFDRSLGQLGCCALLLCWGPNRKEEDPCPAGHSGRGGTEAGRWGSCSARGLRRTPAPCPAGRTVIEHFLLCAPGTTTHLSASCTGRTPSPYWRDCLRKRSQS